MKVLMSNKGLRRYVVVAFRQNLQSWIDKSDITQTKLAKNAGVTKGSMPYILGKCGKDGPRDCGPSIATAAAISIATGVSLDELCGLDELRKTIAKGSK